MTVSDPLSPTILAVDASSQTGSVALWQNNQLMMKVQTVPGSHADYLLVMLNDLLQEGGIDYKDIDLIAYGAGPGSFTGLRICLGIVQGLAYGNNLPVMAISTLEAMAYHAHCKDIHVSDKNLYIPALDARMGEVYWAALRYIEDSRCEWLVENSVDKPEIVEDAVQAFASEHDVMAVGPGWNLESMKAMGLQTCSQDCVAIAGDIASLAATWYATTSHVSVMDAEPMYVRNEIAWKKRERKRG